MNPTGTALFGSTSHFEKISYITRCACMTALLPLTLSTIKSGASGKLNNHTKYKAYRAKLKKKGFAITDFLRL